MPGFDTPPDGRSERELEERAGTRRRGVLIGLCAIVAAAAALIRIRGAMNDLWLDEIWSLHFARSVSSPLDILTRIHHDNNHYLNTFFLYLFRSHGNWPGFRALSIAAGVGTVVVAGLIGNRRSKVSALLLMLVTAFSYVLVLYSSEARGYSLVVFFCLLGFLLLSRYLEDLDWRWAALFSVCAVMGFLSHLAFVHFYLAALAWSAYGLWRKGVRGKRLLGALGACHGAPLAFLAFLYVVDIQKLRVGGGTVGSQSLMGHYFNALAWAMGSGTPEALRLVLSVAAVLFLAGGLRLLHREKSGSEILAGGAAVVVPLVLLAFRRPAAMYPRYFIVPMAFLLLLTGICAANLFERGGWRRGVCIAFMALYFAVNGGHIGELFSLGRGQYGSAVNFLEAYSRRRPITVGGDQDFRVGTVLIFYAGTVQGRNDIGYCLRGTWPPQGPEWVILEKESYMEDSPPCQEYVDGGGNRYDFVKVFPSAPLSGLHWFLYHNSAYSPRAPFR